MVPAAFSLTDLIAGLFGTFLVTLAPAGTFEHRSRLIRFAKVLNPTDCRCRLEVGGLKQIRSRNSPLKLGHYPKLIALDYFSVLDWISFRAIFRLFLVNRSNQVVRD